MLSMDIPITHTTTTMATTLMATFPSIMISMDSIILMGVIFMGVLSVGVTMRHAIGKKDADPDLLKGHDGGTAFLAPPFTIAEQPHFHSMATP
jgi:hypothetical protein